MAPTGWATQEQRDFLFSHMTAYLDAQKAGRLTTFWHSLFLAFFATFPDVPPVPQKPGKVLPVPETPHEPPDETTDELTELQRKEAEARVAHGRALQAHREVRCSLLDRNRADFVYSKFRTGFETIPRPRNDVQIWTMILLALAINANVSTSY
jgi:hypothetical protein